MVDYMDTVYASSNDAEVDTVFKCTECGSLFSHDQDDVYEEDTCEVCQSGYLKRFD